MEKNKETTEQAKPEDQVKKPFVLDDGTIRTIDVELEDFKVSFDVGPGNYIHVAGALKFCRDFNLIDPGGDGSPLEHYRAAARITAWRGVELKDGSPAPCTIEAILLYFGQYPQALVKFLTGLKAAEARDLKN